MTDQLSATSVHGTTEPGFEPVAAEFERLLAAEEDARGQFSAYLDGRQIADLWGGDDVSADDLQGVFSSTKGVSAICIALLIQRGELSLDAPVARYWPEFAAGGKADVTVRIALSHQAGLVGVEPQLTIDEMLDHPTVAARLAAAVPAWRPGNAHGYHALTIGTLMDELTRRTLGVPSPISSAPRSATRAASTSTSAPPPTSRAGLSRCSRSSRRRRSSGNWTSGAPGRPTAWPGWRSTRPSGRRSELLPNLARSARSGQAAAGAVCTARGLARLYAMCISEVDGLPRILTPETVTEVTQIQTVGDDLILRCPTRYGIVFQKSDDRLRSAATRRSATTARAVPSASPTRGTTSPTPGSRVGCPSRRRRRPGLGLAKVLRSCLPAQP